MAKNYNQIVVVNPNIYIAMLEIQKHIQDGYTIAKNGVQQYGVLWEITVEKEAVIAEIEPLNGADEVVPSDESKQSAPAVKKGGRPRKVAQ